MKIMSMRRLCLRRVATLTVWIIIALCLTLTFQMAITWHLGSYTRHIDFRSPLPYMAREKVPRNERPARMYDNSVQQNRIEQVKRELNDSTLTNEATYPANRIGRYIFFNPNLCKNDQNLDLIIIVHTATTHFERRQRIRATFANSSLFYPAQIRVAFLLGKTNKTTIMEMLLQEHKTYNDTVMGDFIDDYHNLSIKGVMGYRWVKDHCANADCVIKIDDDVVLNMYRLLHLILPKIKIMKKTIFCNVWRKGLLYIERSGQWKVESHIFPNMDTYPYDFCSGFTVIMTPDLMDLLYQAALITPYLWVDDFYLFGILPFVVGNVSFHQYQLDKNMTQDYNYSVNCLLTQGVRCPIFSTNVVDDYFWPYWKVLQDVYVTANTTV